MSLKMKEPSWLSGKVEGNMDDVNWVRVLMDASDSVTLLDCNKGVEHVGTASENPLEPGYHSFTDWVTHREVVVIGRRTKSVYWEMASFRYSSRKKGWVTEMKRNPLISPRDAVFLDL